MTEICEPVKPSGLPFGEPQSLNLTALVLLLRSLLSGSSFVYSPAKALDGVIDRVLDVPGGWSGDR
jgi:hypothetical protein